MSTIAVRLPFRDGILQRIVRRVRVPVEVKEGEMVIGFALSHPSPLIPRAPVHDVRAVQRCQTRVVYDVCEHVKPRVILGVLAVLVLSVPIVICRHLAGGAVQHGVCVRVFDTIREVDFGEVDLEEFVDAAIDECLCELLISLNSFGHVLLKLPFRVITTDRVAPGMRLHSDDVDGIDALRVVVETGQRLLLLFREGCPCNTAHVCLGKIKLCVTRLGGQCVIVVCDRGIAQPRASAEAQLAPNLRGCLDFFRDRKHVFP